MNHDIVNTIFGLAMLIGCLFFLSGIGWLIYDACKMVGFSMPVIIIMEGVYILTAGGLFLDALPGPTGAMDSDE